MKVQTVEIRGSYDELVDAAEDISQILGAVANNQLDLTPIVQSWLNEQLERIELAFAGQVPAAVEGRA
jgi:hypothetical protein